MSDNECTCPNDCSAFFHDRPATPDSDKVIRFTRNEDGSVTFYVDTLWKFEAVIDAIREAHREPESKPRGGFEFL